ncbi:hypothetical protein [Allostreptomyces psammosilenae]|uniref:DUF1440 domain-containing protein n=1 Tax=Allostreptomyces psammosilenae TaxID=1892865 RepID=A0A852ZYQ8_9ACTN|nr:hypothetical protein [Allostreptomyces psammosilenae]NYI07195.1 hypothetical protein [Allostreptomyces psammosilenae]
MALVRLLTSAAQGAVAGVAGTTAMSTMMEGAGRLSGLREQPPRTVMRALLPGRAQPRPVERSAAVLGHLGFGATSGALFGVLTAGRRPPSWLGAAYGLAVWAASYEGWIPAAGILPPAHRDHPHRAATLALAHLPYGVVTARALRRMRR